MQIRCNRCNRPFAISKEVVHQALDTMESEDLHHFNVGCPHCRRKNRISRDELLHAAPDWSAKKKAEPSTD